MRAALTVDGRWGGTLDRLEVRRGVHFESSPLEGRYLCRKRQA
jgi:hypothetical protein